MEKKRIFKAVMAMDYKALISAGYSLSSLRSAGYSASDLRTLDNIPILKNPYTKLLNDINNKKRIFNQSTFGTIKEFDEANSVCGTPMCTAGHLVNMAGRKGYELKNLTSFAIAAILIHKAAHPDIPYQNYGSIPQDDALAYIECMAALEKGELTKDDLLAGLKK